MSTTTPLLIAPIATPPPPAVTSTGLGSGINISGMVTSLVAAESGPQTAQYTAQATGVNADLTAVGTLKNALYTFQTSVQTMQGMSTFQANTATSGNTAAFTATADGTAIPGSYAVTVTQLAQSAEMRSGDYSSATALVGAGTLAISLGTNSFNISTDNTTTLTGLRDAINQASGNPGITASIINVDTGSQLLLTSNQMGAANTIGVKATATNPSPGSDLSTLATANLTAVKTPADAVITLDGQQVTRQSNSFSDVVPGVTFALSAPTTTAATLSIAANPAATTSNVQSFISAYNALASTLSNLSNYNSTTHTASQLFGDPMLTGVKHQIYTALTTPVSGITGFSTLAEIGITPDSTGALVLNSSVFNSAMAANPTGVATLFASATGLAGNLNTVLNGQLATDGVLATRVTTDNTQFTSIANQQTQLNARMAALNAQYLKQFNAMDALVGQLQNTSNALTSMLANLPGFTGTTNVGTNTKIG
jgi:flagellar hook-associated protein 2